MNHIPTNENHRGDPQGGEHHPRIGHHTQQHHHPHPQHLPQHPGQPPPHGAPPPTYSAYKVLVDPLIHKGAQKMVRYDGVFVPGDPMHIPPTPKDPRTKLPHALWKRFEPMELPVPRFKVDENYVADPPKTEVTIENLNDNVDAQFLRNMTSKFGPIEELTIHYHPITRKHLGLARLVFEEVKSARECVKSLHVKSVMGQQLNCYLDPRGASCQKMFFEMTTEQQKPEPKLPSPEEEQVPDNGAEETSPTAEDTFNNRRRFERDREPERYHDGRYPRDRDGTGNHRSEFGTRERSSDGRWSSSRVDWSRDNDHSQHHHHDSKQHSMYSQHHLQNRPRDFDPSYSQPDYWLQASQRYAQQAQTAPLSQNANDSSGEHETGGEATHEDNDDVEEVNGETGEHQVDLDTRLKMLMRDKTGAMPAFLLQEFNSSDSSDKEADAEVAATFEGVGNDFLQGSLFKHDPLEPLSTPPSPFISKKHYKKNLKWRVKHARKVGSKASDQMSLSSLPSVGGTNKLGDSNQQPHHFPPFNFYPTHLPGQPQFHQHPPMGYQPHMFYSAYPGFHAPHGFIPPSHYMGWESTAEESMAQPQETREVTVKDVVSQTVTLFVDELRRALSKDLQKKMCETYAFNVFDQWWDEREKHYQGKRNPQSTTAVVSVSSSVTAAISVLQGANKENTSSNIADRSAVSKLPRIPKAEMLSSIFAKQRENLEANRSLTGVFGAGGSLGFGFRGTIPKLPSFKRKPTITSQSNKRRSPKRSDSMSTDEDSSRKSKSDRRKDHEIRRAERMDKVRRDTKEGDRKHGKKTSSRKDKGRSDELSDISSDDNIGSSQVKATDENWRRKKKSSASSSPAGAASSDNSSTVQSQKSTKQPQSSEEDASKSSASSSSSSSKSSSASGSSSSTSSSSSGSSSSSDSESGRSDTSVKESTSQSTSSSSSSSDDEKAIARRKRMAPSRRAEVVTLDSKENFPNGEPTEVKDDSKSEPSAFISDHSYARPIAEKQTQYNSQFSTQFANEHDYSRTSVISVAHESPKVESVKPTKREPLKPRKRANVEAMPLKPIIYPPQQTLSLVKFKARSENEEYNIMFKFLTEGLDLEDARYFKIAYKMMLSRDDTSKILNFTHWVDHPVAEPSPPKKKKKEEDYSRPHLTGSCRTEGYYKMDPREKRLTKYHLQRPDAYAAMSQTMRISNTEGAVTKAKGMTSQNQSREARNIQRRQLAVIGEEAINSDLLKFNQLKFRRKQLSFGKSAIHDWGLFAQEDIGADEMVIEYVGEVIRPHLSDLRETSYEKLGIRSSYLFRIDQDSVVDATKCGSLSRFINHSCEPNCYAKIITIEGEKKIVIYSKQPIASGEEITYDYKFPVEDEKIPCLCGAKSCRKYLN